MVGLLVVVCWSLSVGSCWLAGSSWLAVVGNCWLLLVDSRSLTVCFVAGWLSLVFHLLVMADWVYVCWLVASLVGWKRLAGNGWLVIW